MTNQSKALPPAVKVIFSFFLAFVGFPTLVALLLPIRTLADINHLSPFQFLFILFLAWLLVFLPLRAVIRQAKTEVSTIMQYNIQAEHLMTKQLKVLLTVMVVVFSFLMAIVVLVTFVTLPMVINDPAYPHIPIAENIRTVGTIVAVMWLPLLFPMIVSIHALKIKRKEEKGYDVPLKSKRIARTLLQIVFVTYLGVPAILGGGYLSLNILGAILGSLGQGGDSSGGVSGVYYGIPFSVSDNVLGTFGELCGAALVASGFILLVSWLFKNVLPIIKRDF